jgi:hypothetical protein
MKIIKFFLMLFWVLSSYHHTSAQMQFKGVIPKVGAGFNEKGIFADISAGWVWSERNPSRARGGDNGLAERVFVVSFGAEPGYDLKNDIRVLPKLVAEYHFIGNLPVTFRLQNRYFPAQEMKFQNASWQICPEIGFNFWQSRAFLTYGYSMPVTHRETVAFVGHQVYFGLNLYKRR